MLVTAHLIDSDMQTIARQGETIKPKKEKNDRAIRLFEEIGWPEKDIKILLRDQCLFNVHTYNVHVITKIAYTYCNCIQIVWPGNIGSELRLMNEQYCV